MEIILGCIGIGLLLFFIFIGIAVADRIDDGDSIKEIICGKAIK